MEEMDYAQEKCRQIFETWYSGYLIQDSTSSWAPEENAIARYGIAADDTPLHRYVVIPMATASKTMKAKPLPEIGRPCVMYIPDVEYIKRAIPKRRITYDHIETIATNIAEELDLFEVKAERFAQDKCRNNDEDGEHKSFEEIRDEHYLRKAAEFLYCLLVDEEEITSASDFNPTMDRIKLASDTAKTIRRYEMSDINYVEELERWVQKHSITHIPQGQTELGEQWEAVRMPLPPGCVANAAMFSVATPRQSDWILGYSKPPAKIADEMFTIPENFTFAKIIKAMASNTWIKGVKTPTLYQIRIWVDDRNPTLRLEGSAIHEMNNLPAATPARAFWDWCSATGKKIKPAASDATWAQLLGGLNLSDMEGEDRAAGQKLARLQQTYAFAHGGPSSGKSTMSATLACKLVEEGTKQIFWIAPQNSLLNAQAKHFESNLKGKLIIRLLPFMAEVKAGVNGPRNRKRVDYMKASSNERDLGLALNNMKDLNDMKSDPYKVPNSLVRSIAKTKNPALLEKFNVIAAQRHRDPDQKELFADMKSVLLKFAGEAHIILATPVAIAQYINLANDRQPAVIFMDDVGRMTEAATWLVLSKCPNAPALMVGDTEQCKPITQANQKGTAAVFGRQRGASLLERIVQLDHVDVWLTDNHRAKGNVQTPIAMPTAPPSTGLRQHIRAKHLKEMNKMPRMLDYVMSEKFQEALKALEISKAALDDEAAGNDPFTTDDWGQRGESFKADKADKADETDETDDLYSADVA